ncbi:hypothetical protein MBLNU459_g0618t1 [Dothideomycetes sp. NU459]
MAAIKLKGVIASMVESATMHGILETLILVYPIKSLRAYEPSSAEVGKHGFTYDRRFMLLQIQPDGSLKNMHVAHFTELVLLFASIQFQPGSDDPETARIVVTYRPPQGEEKTLEVPLLPDTTDLELLNVDMHGSATKAYKMGSVYNSWLSACLGYDVVLAYLGEHLRPVLMSGLNSRQDPAARANSTSSWLSSLTSRMPAALAGLVEGEQDRITFADCAPFLVVSETSMRDVHNRLPDGEEMDITKFRPNIIVEGADDEWEEDYWSEIETAGGVRLHLVQNCSRCASLNIDYATGKPGTGESGKILKKLQSNRRVDPGAKYSPIFGRYSFLDPASQGLVVSVGDEVTVSKRNAERTVFDWKGLSTS